MKDSVTVFATGKLYWAKIVNNKQLEDNYDGDGREWSVEFEPDDTVFLKENKLLDRLKDWKDRVKKLEANDEFEKAENVRRTMDGRGLYIILKKPELDRDGGKNDPFRIYDSKGEEWDRSKLIGNNTRADVRLNIIDNGPGRKKSIYCQAIRITDLVEYVRPPADVNKDFGGMSKSEATEKKKARSQQTVLDDLASIEE